ncbi:MAG: hypothetical protein K9G46_05510 [Flavobacteriales bacterium]|jgi:hypothetical protein|nr:hypothetical protein [Flavobacteriales bacterium]
MKWFLLLCLIPFGLFAQDSIRYDVDFEFYNGLYLSFEDFRNDNPISFESIISTRTIDDPLMLDDLLKQASFRYKDGLGEIREQTTNRIWGFARQGRPFVKLNASNYMGIVSSRETLRAGNNEFGQFVELGQISLIQVNMTVTSPVQNHSQTGQFLFSINTGKAVHYTVANFEELLKSDSELHSEFVRFGSDKKKKEMFFRFIKRFNEKHPTYFPFYE